MSEAIKKTSRTINYFDIEYVLNDDKTLNDYFSIFDIINDRNNKKDKSRIFTNGAKKLNIFVSDESSIDKKVIIGRIVDIRMDSFPELIKTSDDKIRDIEADDDEGILESTHFILSMKGEKLILSLEHNQYGPRISDYYAIANNYLQINNVLKSHVINPLTNDIHIDYSKRIGRISQVIAKVHKDNFKRIEKIDSGLFSAIETVKKIAETEYITLQLNVGQKQLHESSKLKELIVKVTNYFSKNKNSNNDFDTFKIRASDAENEMKMKDFDLLNIWVKTQIKVEKKPKSRVVLSSDIHSKMLSDFKNQKI
jgi:hypothetical protein